MTNTKPLATLDCETDPFKIDRVPMPFMWNFFDGQMHHTFWGDDCTRQLICFLKSLDTQYLTYAHNGGNFDFYYLIWALENDVQLIRNRIVRAWLGKQELRDSYAIFPDSLSTYKKDEFDYRLMEKETREAHRKEIIHYCKKDCEYLYDICRRFLEEFGDYLTIGSCAMKQLKKHHTFYTFREQDHETFRRFYFGGRNQCFETGIIEGDFELYDINGMYAKCMRDIRHPIGKPSTENLHARIGRDTFFACIEANNRGCLPLRDHRGGLDFTAKRGTFYATIHEINAGLETGTLDIIRVKHAWDFKQTATFQTFIDIYQEKKEGAQRNGDVLGYYFYKRLQNACYGKTAQNPEDFLDCIILQNDVIGPPYSLQYEHRVGSGVYRVFGKPAAHKTYYNIAVGASITGAARAMLLHGLSRAVRPIYCDTDSILCERLIGAEIDPYKMGAWKFEGRANRIAIAGKKLYALEGDFGKDKRTGEVKKYKKAHKGAVLTAKQIFDIARGDTVEYAQAAPKFRLNGEVVFIRREIQGTALTQSRVRKHTRLNKASQRQKLLPSIGPISLKP